mgnify:CR=1 FL=1
MDHTPSILQLLEIRQRKDIEDRVHNFIWEGGIDVGICDKVEDVHLHIVKIIISDQKINLLKSFYMPTQQYKKFIKHQVMHQGKMLWPGILRFYWKRINKSQYAERKKTDTTLIRKYNWIYD